MAKIVFGVCGVGSGHYTRSKVLLDHLNKKHELLIIAGLSAYDKLKKQYKNVAWVDGIEFGFKGNKITNLSTILKNLRKVSIRNYLNIKRLKNKIDEFKPDLIISDWELFTNVYARERKKKLINVDNEHFILYGKINLDTKYRIDYYKSYIISKLFNYGETIIIGLPGQKLRIHKNATIVNPIIKDEIKKLKNTNEDFIVVYKSISNYGKIIELLKIAKPTKFIVYGFDVEKEEDNIIFKIFSEEEFLKDLARSKGVILDGNMTLISEAIYLNKPMLVLPLKNYFEQILNASYVKNNKFGIMAEELNLEILNQFLIGLEKFNKKTYEPGNETLIKKVDSIIEERKWEK